MNLISTEADEVNALPPIPMNITDIALAAIDRKLGNVKRTAPIKEKCAKNTSDVNIEQTNGENEKSSVGNIDKNNSCSDCAVDSKPKFFKDAIGNEYRMKDGKLYIKGWSDTNLKFRILNTTTGKEISSTNKKIQIYGWHSVERVSECEENEKNDNTTVELEPIEEETNNDK